MPRPVPALALAALLATPLAAAAARPSVVVDAPDFRPLPLAVPDLQSSGADGRAAEEVVEVLRADLAISGFFELLDPRGFLADPGEGLEPLTIKFGRWSDVGAEGLVKARVWREGGGLGADLRVHDVRGRREAHRRTLSAADPRALAHRLADEVVRHYTGEPGVFRTQLAAVRRVRAGRDDRYELLLLDADGRNPRVLLGEAAILRLPAWHPDGDRILVTRQLGGGPELWVYRRSDRSYRKLPLGREAFAGVYSPDGSQVAFTSFDERGSSHVWVAQADGAQPRRLTSLGGINVSPSWSPDGRRIAFCSERSGRAQIYVMNADGSEQRRITFQGDYNTSPRWSPRGDLIAFTARDERKVFDLFVVSPETTKIQRITQDTGRTNEEPSWAPTGRLIAFTSDRAGPPQLVLSDPRGDRQVPVPGGELASPAWGPLPRD